MMNELFDQTVEASEAQREGAARRPETVAPALMGCVDCGTVSMIAAPTIGTCAGCGAELTVLRPDQV